MTLFIKECKKVLLSIPFLILIVTLIIFAYTQEVFPRFNNTIEKPIPNEQNYGTQSKEIPEQIMPSAVTSLYGEFCANEYTTYPIGFYKKVKLNEKKQYEIAEILSFITGVSIDELKNNAKISGDDNGKNSFQIGEDSGLKQYDNGNFTVTMPENTAENSSSTALTTVIDNLTYDQFKQQMDKVDKLLGGGSKYSENFMISNFGQVPLTYEEAIADYNIIKEKDKFTGAYTRLFCDYMVIMLSLLPSFIAVAICMKDRRFKIHELIYARKISSANIIISRYFAIVIMVMIPTIILNYISNISIWGLHTGEILDYLAPLKYSVVWLMPSIMISTAVGMFFTILTDTPIAIAIHSFWWFLDIFIGVSSLKGNYNLFVLSPRHNSLGFAGLFRENINFLIVNRTIFAGISIILLLITIYVYGQKRKGYLNGYEYIKSIFTNFKNKSKA